MNVDAEDLAERLAREGYGEAVWLRELLPVVYADLKRIAHYQLLRHVRGSTLSTTLLVHETWSRLAGSPGKTPVEREHFISLCARVMRQVVIDHARAASAVKRGAGVPRMELREADATVEQPSHALFVLAEALDSLQEADPRLARIVEQHWFIGLEAEELATLHDVSLRTVQRELKRARAWLAELLGP